MNEDRRPGLFESMLTAWLEFFGTDDDVAGFFRNVLLAVLCFVLLACL